MLHWSDDPGKMRRTLLPWANRQAGEIGWQGGFYGSRGVAIQIYHAIEFYPTLGADLNGTNSGAGRERAPRDFVVGAECTNGSAVTVVAHT